MTSTKVRPMEQVILNDPSASRWLKAQIRNLDLRDPVDALNDIEVLTQVLALKIKNASNHAHNQCNGRVK